jgi:hypothetical protein
MRHKLFLFQVDRAYESKLDERCGFANAFWGKWGHDTISEVREQMSEDGVPKRIFH